MSIELLIENYGLLAIFLGAAFEGETAAFLGGVISHRGLLSYWSASLAAVAGSFAGDQFWFFAGRYAGQWAPVRRLMERPALARATRLLEKYQTGFILAFRFLVGLRTISPIVIGTTRITTGKFVILNAVAALVWGQLFTALGYLFGNGIQQILGHLPLHRHLLIAVAAAAVVAAAALLFRRMKPSGRHP
ncbi:MULTISPECIES: DedA family protein [Rhizobium]|uniref:DedA family protein n=1 Tax=Rhizobium TaxID=379 RepID=UPI000BEA1AC8|nr:MULTISPECIES: DedA family protein [Rhizobium]MBX5138257.1 DedA family protein [Rhizobium lentis]MBX5151360.1 DedA family protein [Rhizobium lentis]MBX5176390.1 DedA family protein [Rhizobium lentis]MDK4735463.1 DedA family protein [Rhizobium sp. CNPSo 3490]PDT27169.1 DedA family protein [Rhizobium sp. L9]